MADYPQFEGFSLQDDNFITSEVEYRTIPKRSLEMAKVSRKPGVKLLSHEFGERIVSLRGYVMASTNEELRQKIDAFHTAVTRKEQGQLYIERDRYATAVVSNVVMTDPHYAQDLVPFEIEFLLPDPFWYSSQHLLTFTVASGTESMQETITISGSVFAEPSIKYIAPAGSGQTTTCSMRIEKEGGEYVTWSGIGATTTLAYGDTLTFDYANQKILEGTTSVDVEGIFSRWEPGDNTFTVTFSGAALGGSLEFSYIPRYF